MGRIVRHRFITRNFAMKRPPSYLLLFFVFAFSAAVLQAQSRPRRIGQPPPPTPNSSTPSRPPVLGGSTRPAGSQSTEKPPVAQDNGPEEVGAGDVIKVNTTLVTLPVSVMD